MTVSTKLDTAETPDGGKMVLFQIDDEFSILVDNEELMDSRQNESELILARLGCASVANREAPCILVGGLGLGYTLRQALDMVGPDATVVVSELMASVVKWNREYFGHLNGHPLNDARVVIEPGDVSVLIRRSVGKFDAILLDVDNGPSALVNCGNQELYDRDGITACRRALRERGCLAVWSADACPEYEELVVSCNLHVRRFDAPTCPGSYCKGQIVWVASENKKAIPPGGFAPNLPPRTKEKGRRRREKRAKKRMERKLSYSH